VGIIPAAAIAAAAVPDGAITGATGVSGSAAGAPGIGGNRLVGKGESGLTFAADSALSQLRWKSPACQGLSATLPRIDDPVRPH
jgi:hypothetical protein